MAAPIRTPRDATRPSFVVARMLLGALVVALSMVAGSATASSPFLFTPSDEVREASPTFRYANMSDEEAYAELDRRGVPYTKEGRVDGVRAPVRLAGLLHGVHVHSSLPEDQRADSLFEILDARLALSLDDFCELLSRHDVVEVVHYTMYRPNGPRPEETHGASSRTAKRSNTRSSGKRSSGKRSSAKKSRKGLGKGASSAKQRSASRGSGKKQKAGSKPRSKGKPASSKTGSGKSSSSKSSGKSDSKSSSHKSSRKSSAKASKPARRASTRSASRKTSRRSSKGRRAETREVVKQTYAPPGTRHPAGLAIDVGGLRKRDGRWLSVAHHFDGRLGARTCGANATPPKSAEGRELWSIVCEAADLGLFTYVLTPNFDKWHADHLHMEIRGDVRWFLYH